MSGFVLAGWDVLRTKFVSVRIDLDTDIGSCEAANIGQGPTNKWATLNCV